MSAYLDQVCLVVESALGVRSTRIPGSAPAAYAVVWSQGAAHGNRLIRAQEDDAPPTIPVLSVSSPAFKTSAATSWADYHAIFVQLQVSEECVQNLRAQFAQSFAKMGGKLPPCALIGLFSGGGLPHSDVAVALRSLPGFADLLLAARHCDGREVSEDLPRIMTSGCVLGTSAAKSRYSGLSLHRDNDIVSGCKEVFYIHGQVFLRPPAEGFLRSGCLSAILPATPEVYRDHLVGLASRSSMTESALIHKGPRDRPAPGYVYGGPAQTLSQCNSRSNEELCDFITKNCPSYLRALLPPAPAADEILNAKRALLKRLADDLGPAISSVPALRALAAKGEPIRALLMRGLAGEMTPHDLRKVWPGGPVHVAENVFSESARGLDPQHVVRWVGNTGRKRRRAESTWTQPLGPASKKRE